MATPVSRRALHWRCTSTMGTASKPFKQKGRDIAVDRILVRLVVAVNSTEDMSPSRDHRSRPHAWVTNWKLRLSRVSSTALRSALWMTSRAS